MPDRIVRDELLDSERWLALKDNADRLAFVAVLLKADDFGNFDAGEYRLLRLWRDFGINTTALVAKTLAELVDHDLIRLYRAGERGYLHIPRFKQRLRFTKRVCPKSPWNDDEEKQRVTKNSPDHSRSIVSLKTDSSRMKRREVKRSEENLKPSSPSASDPQSPSVKTFEIFWNAYPATHRRVGKAKCLSVWQQHKHASIYATIVAHVLAMKATRQWQEGFEPAPLTYLNQRRWEDGLPTVPAAQQPSLQVAL